MTTLIWIIVSGIAMSCIALVGSVSLARGGWTKKYALLFNFVSALTFLLGGLVAYFSSQRVDVDFLIPFAAGKFVYIAAADLVPEIKHGKKMQTNLLHFASFVAGIGILLVIKLSF